MDEDNDCVAFTSSEELLDAISTAAQNGGKLSMKIGVEVRERKKEVSKEDSDESSMGSLLAPHDIRVESDIESRWNHRRARMPIIGVIMFLLDVLVVLTALSMAGKDKQPPIQERIQIVTPNHNRSQMPHSTMSTNGPHIKYPSAHNPANKTIYPRSSHFSSSQQGIQNVSIPKTDGHVPPEYLLQDLFAPLVDKKEKFSPLFQAYKWILNDPNWKHYPKARLFQRFALVALYYATNGPHWKRSDDWLSYQIHECHWWPGSYEVSICGKDKYHRGDDWKYKRLLLPFNELKGTLPGQIFQWLPSLREIQLHSNGLNGSLPNEIAHLTLLKQLLLHRNYLTGIVPPAFFMDQMSLQELRLDHNRLTLRQAQLMQAYRLMISRETSGIQIDLAGNNVL
jgi:hypothetical protein